MTALDPRSESCGIAGRLFRSRKASVLLNFAIVLPILLSLAGFSLDYAALMLQRQRLQTATDAAALAGAKELSIPGPSDMATGRVKAMVQSAFDAFLSGSSSSEQLAIEQQTVLEDDGRSVRVTATQKAKSYFGPMFGMKIETLTVTAAASVVGTMNLCVLGLERTSPDVVSLGANSSLVGKGCAVYANSTSSSALAAKSNSKITADLICTAGGLSGGADNFDPKPVTDCPQLPDPLADRQPPSIPGCTHQDLVVANQTTKLSAGVYCGGLIITSNAKVSLLPGTYVIKDGPLEVHDNSSLTGQYVGFHLVGPAARILFTQSSAVELAAPKDGAMAGMLFFEDRAEPTGAEHKVTSKNARKLLGTIYLPQSTFTVDAVGNVADQSAYTAIIVKRLQLKTGPALVLNTDYGATDVPVPKGVGSMTGKVALTR